MSDNGLSQDTGDHQDHGVDPIQNGELIFCGVCFNPIEVQWVHQPYPWPEGA